MAKKFYTEDLINGFAIVFSETPVSGFTEVTDYDELLALHDNRYIQAEKDGKDFHRHFKARLYMEILNGNQTIADAIALESHLKLLKSELITGDWISASMINSTTTLLGIYDQILKDEVQLGIDTYISENY